MNMQIRVLSLMLLVFMSVSCARHSQNFYFGHYSDAERSYNDGKYEEAIKEYQAYISEDPEGNMAIIAHYYMGKSHVALGQVSEAKKIFQDIITKHPESIWAEYSKTQLQELGAPV